jgi:hypothetical protein
VNFAFSPRGAASFTRSSACDTLSLSRARRVPCWFAFPLVPVLGSICSAADCSVLFADFTATTTVSDVSGSCIIGDDSSSCQCEPVVSNTGLTRDLPVPEQGTSTHARVFDHAWPTGARDHTPIMLPSVIPTTPAPKLFQAFAAPCLAYVLPCRRFACTLANADARLGVDADRSSFIVADFHHLSRAGLTGAPEFKRLFASFFLQKKKSITRFFRWKQRPRQSAAAPDAARRRRERKG